MRVRLSVSQRMERVLAEWREIFTHCPTAGSGSNTIDGKRDNNMSMMYRLSIPTQPKPRVLFAKEVK